MRSSNRSSLPFGGGRRAHVIVVQPDPSAREQLARCLGDEVRVTLCASLGEGSERCLFDPPDALVIAAEVAELPTLDRLRRRTPVVLLSDDENQEDLTAPPRHRFELSVVGRGSSPQTVRNLVRQGLLERAA